MLRHVTSHHVTSRVFMNTASIYVFTFEFKWIYSYMTYGFPIRSFSFQLSKFLVIIARFPLNFNFPSFATKKKEVPFPFPSHQNSQLLCTHAYLSTGSKNIGSLDGYNGIWLAHYLLFQILNISFPLTKLFAINRFPMRIKNDFFQTLVIFG